MANDEARQIHPNTWGDVTNAFWVAPIGVGVGTDAPEHPFHLYSASGDAIALIETDKVNGIATLKLRNDAEEWELEVADSDILRITNGAAAIVKMSPGAPNNSFVILASGNVGLGTAAPADLLELAAAGTVQLGMTSAAASNVNIRLENAAAGGQIWGLRLSGAGHLQWVDQTGGKIVVRYEKGAPQFSFYVNAAGLVGVGGTSTPQYQLDTTGEIGMTERSSDPADPAEGRTVEWMSDGTGAGEDGDILRKITSAGSTITCLVAPFAYASISVVDNTTVTTITTPGVAVQVNIFDTNGESLISTPDHTNNHITAGRAGLYEWHCSATVNSVAGPSSRFEMTVRKNNGAGLLPPLHVDRNLAGGAGASGSVSMVGQVRLAAADTVEVWIENETGTANYTVEDIALTCRRISY